MSKRFLSLIVVFILALFALASCTSEGNGTNAREANEQAVANQEAVYNDSQPVLRFDWSQYRQNLIELQTAMATTTQTTSFFFNQGAENPISQCPSIGTAIPSTAQLTNPYDVVTPGPRERGAVTVGQMEMTGVFTGDSTGTYVMCVSPSGDAYAQYWEGFVMTVFGNAEWVDGQVNLVGEPSFDFSESEAG